MIPEGSGKIQVQQREKRPAHSAAGAGNSREPSDRTADTGDRHKRNIEKYDQEKHSQVFQFSGHINPHNSWVRSAHFLCGPCENMCLRWDSSQRFREPADVKKPRLIAISRGGCLSKKHAAGSAETESEQWAKKRCLL